MKLRRPRLDQLGLFAEPAVAPPRDESGDRSAGPPVDLVRSPRRRRTYKWSLLQGRVRLEVPTGLSPADEARIIANVAERAQRRLARAARASDADLLSLARELARRHIPAAAPRLRSVSWSERQGQRWGSCSTDTGAIRLSSRLEALPRYVLEAVLVHEIAHLVELNHTPAFYALANRYPLAERARGFLDAVDRGLLGTADEGHDLFD